MEDRDTMIRRAAKAYVKGDQRAMPFSLMNRELWKEAGISFTDEEVKYTGRIFWNEVKRLEG